MYQRHSVQLSRIILDTYQRAERNAGKFTEGKYISAITFFLSITMVTVFYREETKHSLPSRDFSCLETHTVTVESMDWYSEIIYCALLQKMTPIKKKTFSYILIKMGQNVSEFPSFRKMKVCAKDTYHTHTKKYLETIKYHFLVICTSKSNFTPSAFSSPHTFCLAPLQLNCPCSKAKLSCQTEETSTSQECHPDLIWIGPNKIKVISKSKKMLGQLQDSISQLIL